MEIAILFLNELFRKAMLILGLLFASLLVSSVALGQTVGACAAGAGGPSPGNTTFPIDCTGSASGTLLASMSSPFSYTTSAGTNTGTIISAVYADGGGTLDFYYQVVNDPTSATALARETSTNFFGFITNAAFITNGSSLGNVFVDGSHEPVTVDSNLDGSVIGFSFYPPTDPSSEIGPGTASIVLIISTDATAYTVGSATVINGGTGSVKAFAPNHSWSVSPLIIDLKTRPLGMTSAPQTVTVTNNGGSSLSIEAMTLTGNNPGDFAYTSACGTTLLPGASCTISVTFKPTAINTRTATLNIPFGGSGQASVQLSGVGTAVWLSPSKLNLGSETVGQVSSPLTIRLTNLGTLALTIERPGITIVGVEAGDFQQTNDCGTSVGAGLSCTITVTFTPSATGKRGALLRIHDNGGGSPQTALLWGKGI